MAAARLGGGISAIHQVLAALVERRFNRARYNAEQVVIGFTDRLRNEVDIDLVTSDVGALVGRVLQPNRLSLWIRD